MLVITKYQRDGYIQIGDDIRVYIVLTKGRQVRIGIEAPVNKYDIKNVGDQDESRPAAKIGNSNKV